MFKIFWLCFRVEKINKSYEQEKEEKEKALTRYIIILYQMYLKEMVKFFRKQILSISNFLIVDAY